MRHLKLFSLSLFLFLGWEKAAQAIDVPTMLSKLEGKKNQLAHDSATTLDIHTQLSFSNVATVNRVQNVITLKFDEDTTIFFTGPFSVTVTYSLYFEDKNAVQDSLLNQSLTVTYDTAGTYRSRRSFTFQGGYKVKIKILSVSSTAGAYVLPALLLTNEINANVDYAFNCKRYAVCPVAFNSSLSQADELYVSWAAQIGADEYDLEWAYVDSTATGNYWDFVHSIYDPSLIFTNSGTRVTISGTTNYKVPLLYDVSGLLFFRVRAVQNESNGTRVEGAWSSDTATGLGRYSFYGHERNLNWQATTSYAEDGKRKSVVQYFDGSLRSRQTVTKDNSTGTTVLAESLYDYQGRAVIQVLPAPTLSTIIQYTRNFNRNISNAEYDKSLYDSLPPSGAYCGLAAAAMGVDSSGAAQYYSQKNPLATTNFHQFIPDASGYPFVETQYTQDNTGRIESQSNVGPDHKIGGAHATKYFYGTPSQKELDGLFGTEVGDYTHYQKNMVRDANGQYSVSYVDMNGKTIATALAGASPATLDALASNSPITITEPVITPASNYTDGLTMTASKGLLVPKGGQHRFIYSLLPDSIRLTDCKDICYDCLYDLEVTITSDCNNGLFTVCGSGASTAGPVIIRRSNMSLTPLDTVCYNLTSFPGIDTTVCLSEGSYLVTKKLTVSRKAMEWYRDSMFLKYACKRKQDFINAVLDSINAVTTCHPDCASCLTAVGSWPAFRDRYMTDGGFAIADTASKREEAFAAYRNALDACSALCNNKGNDEDIRKQMLWDVTPPTGQYADLETAESDPLTILPHMGTPGRHTSSTIVYRDAFGKPDTVYNSAGQRVLPQALTVSEFISQFKPSWAEALLVFHPEYCQLQHYEKYSASHAWDKKFLSVETFKQARDSGFLNPTNYTSAAPWNQFSANAAVQDPLFNATTNYTLGGVSVRAMMHDSMAHYRYNAGGGYFLTMWNVATIAAKCGDKDTTCAEFYRDPSKAFDTTTLCGGELDVAWQNFRQLYLESKRAIVQKLIDSCVIIPIASPQVRRFAKAEDYPDYNNVSTDQTQAQQGVQSSLNASYRSNCEAYSRQWMFELAQCPSYDTTQLKLHVLPKLIEVCVKGSDIKHPFGSSTLSPDSAYTFTSFEDVLNWYNDSLSLSTSTREVCNGFLITAPKPYNQTIAYGLLPVWGKPDSCTCAKIDELYTDYVTHNSSYSTFSAYLAAVHHTVISQGALDTLRGLCSGTIGCKFLPVAIQVPPALQCGVSGVCINCEQMRSAYVFFRQRFPNSVPKPDTANNTSQQSINKVFANFMNVQFGFSYSETEYLAFMQDCKIGVDSATDSLWKRLADFKNYYSDLAAGKVWRSWKITPIVPDLLKGINVLLQARLKPDAPQLPTGYGLRSYSLSFDRKLNSVIKNTYSTDSSFHMILPLRKDYNKVSMSFPELNNNVVTAGDFVSGIASLDDLKKKYYATTLHDIGISFQNMWSSGADPLTYAYYGISTPDKKFLPLTGGGWENHVYSIGFYTIPTSVIDSASYFNFHSDSVFVGGWFGDYGTHAVRTNRIKRVKNIRFATNFLPLPTMGDFEWTAAGLKVTLELRDGTEIDAYPFATYGWDYIPFKEYTDSNLYNPNCAAAFRYFFNQQSGTNYTTTQIDSIYNAAGIRPNYCDTTRDTSKLLCGKSEPVFTPFVLSGDNCSDNVKIAEAWGTELYTAYVDSLKGSFETAYLSKCLKAYQKESFAVEHPLSEYHYTLYYYDQAGNLVKTVPPKGVDNRMGDATFLADVANDRAAGNNRTPNHTLVTQYRYNTLNQVIAQKSPDGGASYFWYDRLGRLATSQNAKQATANNYSYTVYDVLGRITEVGQIDAASQMRHTLSRRADSLATWLAVYSKEQITRTVYDIANSLIEPQLYAKNLRNRVAYSQVIPTAGGDYTAATYYSYDIHGNVDTLLQDYKSGIMADHSQRFKRVVYRYDLISGKVNHVAYQPGQRDAFYHRYQYDAENKLTAVYTSADSLYWERDAAYAYYKHGPLARTVLGQQSVQGTDYAYTLQGWLKGVNGTLLCSDSSDIGRDGAIGTSRQYIAKDAFGFSLHYYTGDYAAIGKPYAFKGTATVGTAIASQTTYSALYNGNISAMSVNIGKLAQPVVYNYRYDQLNRLKKMTALFAANTCGTGKYELWDNALSNTNDDYGETISYDPNGNISTYERKGTSAIHTQMDKLEYFYASGTNQVDRLQDDIDHLYYDNDIDNQGSGNYQYDQVGNLVVDQQADISVDWTVYGKIRSIGRYTRGGGAWGTDYTYDAAGNRISKKIIRQGREGVTNAVTWYVRDAQGNVMATYEGSIGNDGKGEDSGPLYLTEQHLYGSSRLGMWHGFVDMDADPAGHISIPLLGAGDTLIFERGRKAYELANHLGNVLVTISDKKVQHNGGSGVVDYYTADVLSAQDYYPGGMLMPGRKFSNGSSYKYGFAGKEKDDELKGEGNSYDFGARIYDPRISRWLSVDPLQAKYPDETPYLYTGGNPIYFADPDGKDRIDYYKIITNKGTVQIKVVTEHAFKAEAQSNYGGLPDLVKFNYNVYHTIDLRGAKPSITKSEVTDYSSGIWDIGLGEYAQIKLTGKDDGLLIHGPQAVIYGKGTEDPGWGPKADPSKGILSINYAELSDIMGDVLAATKDYTLKDPKDLVWKAPEIEYKVGKEVAKKIADNDREGSKTSEPSNSAERTQVYVREDNFGTGPRREKKGSAQNHAYWTDSVTRKKSGANGSKVDTVFIRQKKNP